MCEEPESGDLPVKYDVVGRTSKPAAVRMKEKSAPIQDADFLRFNGRSYG